MKTCDGLVNNFSNMIYVIGREKHQSLEPVNNEIKIARSADAPFLAAEVNPQALKNILHKLPPVLREGMLQSVKLPDDNRKVNVSVNMKFPEPGKNIFIAPAAYSSRPRQPDRKTSAL